MSRVLEDVAIGQTWVQVNLVDFLTGPDLTPPANHILEAMFEVGQLMVVRASHEDTGVPAFISGFPLATIVAVQFTLK